MLGWVILVWSSNSIGDLASRWDRQRFTKRALLELKSSSIAQKRISYLHSIDLALFKELVYLAFIQCRLGSELAGTDSSSISDELVLNSTEGGKVVIRISQTRFRPNQFELRDFEEHCLGQAAQGYYVYLGSSPLPLVKLLAARDSVRLISGARLVTMLVQGKSNWTSRLPFQAQLLKQI